MLDVEYYNSHKQEHHHAHPCAAGLKSIIYGALDGIISTFNIIVASIAAGLDKKPILVLALANLISDGLSMGLGDFISSYSEKRYVQSEYSKEDHEMKNNFKFEFDELVGFYTDRGMRPSDATIVVSALAKYPDIFLEQMVKYELGLDSPEPTCILVKEAALTFVSFCVFGGFPIIGFLVSGSIIATAIVTGVTLFLLGVVEALLTKQEVFTISISITVLGLITATVSYLIGFSLEKGGAGN